MPHSDPERRRAYQREYQRKRRAGLTQEKRCQTAASLPAGFKITTAHDVLQVVEAALGLVVNADADPIVKGRSAGYLCGVALKALEASEFEERLRELEARFADE